MRLQVADAHRPFELQGDSAFEDRLLRGRNIEFVFDLTHQLFENIFDGNDPGGRTEFIHHHRQVPLALLELLQQFGQDLGFWNHQDVVHDLADFHGGNAGRDRLAGAGGESQPGPTHQVLGVEHADDVFGAALRVEDGNTRMLFLDHARQGFVQRQITG